MCMLEPKEFGKSLNDALYSLLGHSLVFSLRCPPGLSLVKPPWSVFGQSLRQSLNGLIRYGLSDSMREMYD